MRSLLAFLALVPACAVAEGDTMKTGPVILELFTSQGCSSCPPADRLLSKISDGEKLVGLSFHVDYWNDLGWQDPYSLPAWTERQHAYARALGDTRVYTPELVVGGAKGMVGSNAGEIANAIAKADRPALLATTATWSKSAVEITVTAPANADVVVAIFENAKTNKVPRGENSGTTSAHKNVVRRLERIATAGQKATLKVALDEKWQSVGAVVFAQRSGAGGDKKIIASAVVPRS